MPEGFVIHNFLESLPYELRKIHRIKGCFLRAEVVFQAYHPYCGSGSGFESVGDDRVNGSDLRI